MYKMCGKCGFFYDDVENPQCPQCGEASDVKTTIGNQPKDINEDYSTKCPNCENVQSKDIHRCLKCSEIIDHEKQEIQSHLKAIMTILILSCLLIAKRMIFLLQKKSSQSIQIITLQLLILIMIIITEF